MVTYIDYIHNFVIRTLIDWKPGQISITVIDQLFKANERVISITRSKNVLHLYLHPLNYIFFILSGEEYSLFMNKNKLDVTSLYEL